MLEGLRFSTGSRIAVTLQSCHDITIRNCTFVDCPGVYALNCTGNIVVEGNEFLGLPDAIPGHAHSVQFNNCTGAGNRIINNTSVMPLGTSEMEDHINLFASSGVSGDPILVDGNVIRGGGPSVTGSGIILGDNGGSYQQASNNLLIRPGQVGIGVASGEHITVTDNTVASDVQAWSAIGIYANEQYGQPVGDITIQGNTVAWLNGAGVTAPRYDAGNVGPIAGWDDNDWFADLATLLAL